MTSIDMPRVDGLGGEGVAPLVRMDNGRCRPGGRWRRSNAGRRSG